MHPCLVQNMRSTLEKKNGRQTYERPIENTTWTTCITDLMYAKIQTPLNLFQFMDILVTWSILFRFRFA
jgi:hypothetical protein